ncbi:phosphatase PAP2 family protein [Vibrio sinaloensis]|uniref:phosphatase PAP2 family protein n=1 Tax=Photobacterium sp. (strain ATCC 43367) TaxID=379097 RepID=UPI0035F01B54
MKEYLLDKRHGLGLLAVFLLAIGPLALSVNHIDLLSDVSSSTGWFFTALTDSAGSKGFLFTLAILLVISWKIIDSPKAFFAKLVQLGIILVIGFAAKTGLKHMTESPRPYTELIAHQLLIPQAEHFYSLNSVQQGKVIDKISQQVSHWRTIHWQGEKDYSFPSGHTIFASICLAFFGGLFVRSGHFALAALVGLWAIGVAYSRLWLGMHRPIDLVGSILFISIVFLVVPRLDSLLDKYLDRVPLLSH